MNLTVPYIVNQVAEYYKVPVERIYTGRRKREGIKYKHISMFLCNELFRPKNIKRNHKPSLEFIASHFISDHGIMKHSSLYHALHSIQNSYDTNKQFRREIDELREKIGFNSDKVINNVQWFAVTLPNDNDTVFQENDFFTN